MKPMLQILFLFPLAAALVAEETKTRRPPLELPDREVLAAYEHAATQNVLAALNPQIFPGYWSVCADGVGFGRGNTYPSLDGHQMADALLFLGQVEVVKANWEYPANLIRIVQRFLFGVDSRLDGSLVLAPTVTAAFWEQGFGQTVAWRDRNLRYRMQQDRIEGTYSGVGTQRLGVKLRRGAGSGKFRATVDGRPVKTSRAEGLIFISLPARSAQQPCRFELTRLSGGRE